MREDALDRISEELKKSAPTIPPEVLYVYLLR